MKLRRRDLFLLGIIWGLVAILIAIALLALRDIAQRPVGPAVAATQVPTSTLVPIYTPVPSDITARSLYPLALEKAVGWREDAQLVSIRGSWEQTAINLLGRPVEWTYRFYSPRSRLLYFVTVTPDGQVGGMQHLRPVNQAPPILPIDAWQVDSPTALSNWLNSGGGQFLGSRPGSQVLAQLSMRSAGAAPQWTVVGYDRTAEAYLVVSVQAATGDTVTVSREERP